MDCGKIGGLIAGLRKEKGLTQRQIADALGLSPKTVSKWECGIGCPDLSVWPELSAILGVDVAQMMEGELTPNRPDSGNINKIRFHVCPGCGNILVSTGSAGIVCCGRRVERLEPAAECPPATVEESDMEYYVTVDHPMEKDHYLAFAAYVKSDRVHLVRMYPEQGAALRLPCIPGGRLYLYCVRHGLSLCPVRFL